MTGSHAAWLAALTLLAVLVALVPRRLIAEAGGERPSARSSAMLAISLLLVGVLAYGAGQWLGVVGHSPLGRAGLAAALIALAMIGYVDGRYMVIPDLCTVILALLALVPPLALPWREALAGAGLCGGLLLAVAWGYRRYSGVDGMGFGDVKLAAALGALLGMQNGLWTICLAAIGAAAGGLFAGRSRPRDEATEGPMLIPYGTALAVAGAGWLVWSRR